MQMMQWSQQRLKELIEHGEDLKSHGVPVVPAKLEGDSYRMPYVYAKSGLIYLRELLRQDTEAFLREMDKFRDLILQSSEHVSEDMGDGRGVVLKRGYFDMVPLNSFLIDREYVFFDQEFCIEDLPVKVMEWRQVASFYFGDPAAEKILPMDMLLERYGLKEEMPRWKKIEWEILGGILKDDKLKEHRSKYRTSENTIRARRTAIDRHCMNIFSGIEGKKLYLFGSGKYAERFLDLYGIDFPVCGLLDNDESRQGTKKNGIIPTSTKAATTRPLTAFAISR